MNRFFTLVAGLMVSPLLLTAYGEDAEMPEAEMPEAEMQEAEMADAAMTEEYTVAYSEDEMDVLVSPSGAYVYMMEGEYYPYYTHYKTKHVGYRGAEATRSAPEDFRSMHESRHAWRMLERSERMHQGMYGLGR